MAKVIAEKVKKGYVDGRRQGREEGRRAAWQAAKSRRASRRSQLKVAAASARARCIASRCSTTTTVTSRSAPATACFASSDGKKFHRRPNTPGTSYGLFALDGVAYSMGGPFMRLDAMPARPGASRRGRTTDYIFAMLRDSHRHVLARLRRRCRADVGSSRQGLEEGEVQGARQGDGVRRDRRQAVRRRRRLRRVERQEVHRAQGHEEDRDHHADHRGPERVASC